LKKSTLIPAITIPVLALITGIVIIPAFTDTVEVNKNCEEQTIIINQTDGSVFISCIPAKGGTVIGNRTLEYVD